MEKNGGKRIQAREVDKLGRNQGKIGLVGERKLQTYAPHGVERTN